MAIEYNTARPHIAAFVIFRENDKIAFVLRENTAWMNGHYGLIAGKVEHDESFLEAAIREAKEEAGIELTAENLEHVLTIHRNGEDGMTWVDTIFEAHNWQGELTNAEPDKHKSLDWLDPNDLPDNIIPVCGFYLEQIAAGNHYAEYGWEA
jgi:8-oxo-dGTP diphosphatase